MSEKHREPEVPEERVPVVECLDGLARITSKELAPILSVKSGTLQNARSTRPRVVVGLGKSARMKIVRLMNNLGAFKEFPGIPRKCRPEVNGFHWDIWNGIKTTLNKSHVSVVSRLARLHTNRSWLRGALNVLRGVA